MSQQQAVESAQSYIDYIGGFSRQGLIEQLEFEGFTNSDATFAVDYLNIDWNAQAVESAEQYIEHVGGFSRASLIEQLEFDGFTRSEAERAADVVGLIE